MSTVITHGAVSRVQLAALRAAARTGRIRRASILISRLLPGTRWADVVLPGGILAVSLSDPYWSRILTGLPYEPEVGQAIEIGLKVNPDAVLLDCGANIGYWSTTFAQRLPVTAVEALPHIYARLSATATRNGFRAVHAAIWKSSGETLTMSWATGREDGASAVTSTGSHVADVPTVSIDDLVEPGRPAIIKLDVEGAEGAAVEGAARCHQQALWIFEDHGQDRQHSSSRVFFDLGFRTGLIDDARFIPTSLANIDAVKHNHAKGYNFVAWHPDGPWAAITEHLSLAASAPPAS